MVDFKTFHDDIMSHVANRPKGIRLGQAVFNYVDETYGVARVIQMVDNIDCFYNDANVEDFIMKSWDEINLFENV